VLVSDQFATLYNNVLDNLLATDTTSYLPQTTQDSFNLSEDQLEVFSACIDWLNNPPSPYLSVGGYAGTGKTTLISVLRTYIAQHAPKKKVAFACFTGQASQNLGNKLQEQKAIFPDTDTNGTIHKLMYNAVVDGEGRVINWQRNKTLDYDLIIVDEASMVKEDVWDDLLEYKIPILAFGDHGQLPPIGDNFNLMEKPMLRLEKIHRQADGNPIIHLATLARMGEEIPFKHFTSHVRKMSRFSEEATDLIDQFFSCYSPETLILCGSNKNRVRLNQRVRNSLGIESANPRTGDRVVCLKNNYENADGHIYNGMIGTISKIAPDGEHWYQATIDFPNDDKTYQGKISKYQFNSEKTVDTVKGVHFSKIGDRFDFGYALTVHKAQGSQAKRTILFDESHLFREHAHRWLYTAITRAEEELYIFK
jgi:exodeoxyribonuclease-5